MKKTIRDLISFPAREGKGWKDKYRIYKADGRPVDPEAIYFPLRLDTDPRARAAAKLYADLTEQINPELAEDLREKIQLGEEIHARNTGYG